MATYALIAKYRGEQAVYTRTSQDGVLGPSQRTVEGLTSAGARKVVAEEGFALVKSWKEAEQLAAMEKEAASMEPDNPLTWKNKVNGWHRAKTDDGTYNIRRWFLIDGVWAPGPADGSAVGASEARMWVMTFEPAEGESETVPWWKPADELLHSLDHAKTSCQHHANARLLALV